MLEVYRQSMVVIGGDIVMEIEKFKDGWVILGGRCHEKGTGEQELRYRWCVEGWKCGPAQTVVFATREEARAKSKEIPKPPTD
jgi:hypothetical protein